MFRLQRQSILRINAAARLATLVLAGLPALSAPTRAQVSSADLVGHSIKVEWTNTVVHRFDDGSEKAGEGVTRMTLYIGTQKHVFERSARQAVNCGRRCRNGGGNSDLHENVGGLGQMAGRGRWTFENGALVKMVQLPSGARRIVIDFAGSGGAPTCSVSVRDLRRTGEDKIVDRTIGGAGLQELSHTISGQSCEVVSGNLLADEAQ
jgi:hypothetical protein